MSRNQSDEDWVIGLDLSLSATGVVSPWGVGHTITTKLKDGDRRLQQIYTFILEFSRDVDYAVIEDLPYNAQQAGTTGMVQGVARLALMKNEVPYAFLSPATLKKFATGNGRADKAEMAFHLYAYLGSPEVDDEDEQLVGGIEMTDNNQVDAGWLRIAGLTRLGIETKLAHRKSVLDTGKWANWGT